jgi:hypothetical protein
MSSTVSLIAIVQLAVPLAFVLALGLRWLYLRSVRRSMMRSAPNRFASDTEVSSASGKASAVEPPAHQLEVISATPPPREAVRACWQGPCIAAAVHGLAGVGYAFTMACVWGHAAGDIYRWDVILLFSVFFAWPLVIVVSMVATLAWRGVAIVMLSYALIFLAVGIWLTHDTNISLIQVILNWWSANGIGTLLVLSFLARPIRATGPIVVALMMVAIAGVLGMADLISDEQSVLEWIAWIATALGFSGSFGGLAAGLIVFAVVALGAGLIAYLALRLIGAIYRAQWISDQSIQIDAVWLIFAILHAPAQNILTGFFAFLVCAFLARLGLRLFLSRHAADQPAIRLLLLRVFSLGARSEHLFRSFSLLWRYKGSIRMIAGPDLANATVEFHEFLDFLAGRLQRRFITGPAVLKQRLAEAPLSRDPDGRFRVSSFFCNADTWQTVLRQVARESDVVLMDLRGFSPTNKGCIFELNELLEAVRLPRLLIIVDDTSDQNFLAEVLQQGWMNIMEGSVNRGDARPRIHLYRLDPAGVKEVASLVAALAATHSHDTVFV